MFLSGLSARSTLRTLILAHLAHARTHRVWQVPSHRLAGAADWTLGLVTLEQLGEICPALDRKDAHTLDASCVLATALAVVLARRAIELGADRAGDRHGVLQILGGALGTTRALVVFSLWVVHQTLGRARGILAAGGAVNDAPLGVQKPGTLHVL